MTQEEATTTPDILTQDEASALSAMVAQLREINRRITFDTHRHDTAADMSFALGLVAGALDNAADAVFEALNIAAHWCGSRSARLALDMRHRTMAG